MTRALMQRPFGLLLLAGLCSSLSACGSSPATSGSSGPSQPSATTPWKIVATTGFVGELVQAVAGPAAQVQVLMNPGVDPHLFTATRQTVRQLVEADVVVINGLHLEGRLQDSIERLKEQGKPVISLGDGLSNDQLRHAEGLVGAHDPHIWMDAKLWASTVSSVVEVLSKLKPELAADLKTRGEVYQAQLLQLDDEVRMLLSQIPQERRVLVTAHDAFGYFGRAYDVTVAPIQGVSTESEAGVQDIQRVVELVVSRQVPTVFFESSVNPKNVSAVLDGSRARGVRVELGESLFSDSLGPAGTPEGTYFGMLRANANRIATGLQRLDAVTAGGGP